MSNMVNTDNPFFFLKKLLRILFCECKWFKKKQKTKNC